MKLCFFSFILIVGFKYIVIENKPYNNSSLAENLVETNQIDSFYNYLISCRVDTILFLKKIVFDEEGLICWKKFGLFHGILFKSSSETLIKWENIDTSKNRLKEIMLQWLDNRPTLNDTFPHRNLEASHDFKINIYTYLNAKEDKYDFYYSEALFNEQASISKLFFLCNELVNGMSQ